MLTRIILAILVALALTSSIVSAAPAASQAPLEASGDLVERIVTQHSLNITKRAASYPEPIQGPVLRDPTIINLGASYLLCGTGTKSESRCRSGCIHSPLNDSDHCRRPLRRRHQCLAIQPLSSQDLGRLRDPS